MELHPCHCRWGRIHCGGIHDCGFDEISDPPDEKDIIADPSLEAKTACNNVAHAADDGWFNHIPPEGGITGKEAPTPTKKDYGGWVIPSTCRLGDKCNPAECVKTHPDRCPNLPVASLDPEGDTVDRSHTCVPMGQNHQPYTGRESTNHMTIMQEVSASVMNGILSGSMRGNKLPFVGDIAKYAWEYAEAWLAEGKRRGWA